MGIYQTNLSSAQVLGLYQSESGQGSSLNSTVVTVASGATLNVNVNGGLSSTTALTSNGLTAFAGGSLNRVLPRTLASITLSSGGDIEVASATLSSNRTALVTGSLNFAGFNGSWGGQLDLANNDLIVHNGNLSQLTNQIQQGFNYGGWNGSGGILSLSAVGSSSHLTALGIILGSSYSQSSFDGQSAASTDVLIKYTYYGDANLDGKVDGSDYSLIDSGYLTHATGWYNGDFNYDGMVDGSDYTLIDNAFNTQGAQLTAEVVMLTAQLASSRAASVPEPAALGLIVTGAIGVLLRRPMGQKSARFRK